MLVYLIIIITAYLLGNISTSYIVAKRLAGVDIRTQGSGNAGSTNVLRTLGKKAGALTFIGDVLKGLIAVLIARLIAYGVNLDDTTCAYIAVVAVVLGHNYPVFYVFSHTGFAVLLVSATCSSRCGKHRRFHTVRGQSVCLSVFESQHTSLGSSFSGIAPFSFVPFF